MCASQNYDLKADHQSLGKSMMEVYKFPLEEACKSVLMVLQCLEDFRRIFKKRQVLSKAQSNPLR